MGLINVNDNTINLKELIDIKKYQVISKCIGNNENCEVRLFSLYEKEIIRNEIYPKDILLLCLNGNMKVTIDGKDNMLSNNDFIGIKKGMSCFIESITNTMFIQIMIG